MTTFLILWKSEQLLEIFLDQSLDPTPKCLLNKKKSYKKKCLADFSHDSLATKEEKLRTETGSLYLWHKPGIHAIPFC